MEIVTHRRILGQMGTGDITVDQKDFGPRPILKDSSEAMEPGGDCINLALGSCP